jgi:HK97 family phage major capsid protein
MKKFLKLFLNGKNIVYVLSNDSEELPYVETFKFSEEGLKELKARVDKDQPDEIKADGFSEEDNQKLIDIGVESMVEKHVKTKSEVLEEYVFTPPAKKVEKEESPKEMKDLIGQSVIRSFSAEVKDLGNGVMEAIISSEALDRHGERIDMKGMDVKKYMKNPIMAAFHDYWKPSVGRTLKLTKMTDGKLVAKFEWAKDQNPEAKILYDLYKDGFQFAFSIGFMAFEIDGNTFTKTEMLEFSPVLVPANAEALILAKQKGIDSRQMLSHNVKDMNLKEILAKKLEDLTFAEMKFLQEHKSELSTADKAKFKEVLGEDKEEDELDKKINSIVADAISAPMAEVKNALEALVKEDDKAIKKDINLKKESAGVLSESSKEMKFLLFARGLQTKDFKKYIEVVGKDAMNTSDSGTSVLVPPAEFLTEVERLEEVYGVGRKYANIRKSANGNGISYLQGDDDLDVYFTDEAGAKKSTKLGYARKLLAWRKAAGILPITDELTQDSALDLWKDATNRFARAYAKKEDQLIFTQVSGAAPINPGILAVSGVKVVTLTGDSFNDLSYDNLVDMLYGVPTVSEENGRFYFHRDILPILLKIKDDNGDPIWQKAMADGTPSTLLGKEYSKVEVMPSISADAPETKFIIFGDLRYATLGERTGLDIKIFDTGMVGDPDEETQGNDLNLLTQDMQAMRAVKRFNAIVRFPAAFSVGKTGASAS